MVNCVRGLGQHSGYKIRVAHFYVRSNENYTQFGISWRVLWMTWPCIRETNWEMHLKYIEAFLETVSKSRLKRSLKKVSLALNFAVVL